MCARLSFSFHLFSLPALGDPAALGGDDAGEDAEEEDWQEEDGQAQADGEGDEGGDQRQGDDEEGQGDQQDVAHAPSKHPLEATVQGATILLLLSFMRSYTENQITGNFHRRLTYKVGSVSR